MTVEGRDWRRHPLRLHARIAAAGTDVQGDVVNVTNVEIVQTGIEYPLASGPRTFTVDDLADAVASQDDPAIKAPRLKLGHWANLGILEDGQPAIGTVQNLRLEQEGHKIVGDYIGVPEWFANVLPSAYPARSIEALIGVETNTGHKWRMVITDLALLGVIWPGVGTLEDIEALYSVDGPDTVKVLSTRKEVEDELGLPLAASGGLSARVDVDVVRRQYYEQASQEQFWWWIRSMYMEPNELIVENESDGTLYRVPFDIKSEEDVEFGDPVEVKIEYKDKPTKKAKEAAALAASATFRALNPGARVLAEYSNRKDSRMDGEFDPVALRNSLGLEENASDEEVQTALAANGIYPPGQEPGSGGQAPASEQPGTSEAGTSGAGNPTPAPDNQAPGGQHDPAVEQPTAAPGGSNSNSGNTVEPAVASDGTVRLDVETYNQLRAGAAAGVRADTHIRQQDRDSVISAAIQVGKIPPVRKPHYERLWDQDEEGTRTLLTADVEKGGLAAGMVPVTEIGGTPQQDDLAVEAYPAEWLPEIQQGGD
jgi:hypothetical protein